MLPYGSTYPLLVKTGRFFSRMKIKSVLLRRDKSLMSSEENPLRSLGLTYVTVSQNEVPVYMSSWVHVDPVTGIFAGMSFGSCEENRPIG